MQKIKRKTSLALAAFALMCSGSQAQQTQQVQKSALPPGAVTQTTSSSVAVQSTSQVTQPSGNQQGVIYPGQPIVQQAQPATMQAAQPQPGFNGQPQPKPGAPVLPPLPGYTQPPELSPANQAVEDTMPQDTAAAILELRRRLDAVQRAGANSLKTAPVAVARSVDITQAPGETPPVLRVAMGMPTNIVFLDGSGAAWPISYVTPGSPSQFDTLIPEAGTSSVQIRPKNPYAYGGFTVKLVNNDIPISIIVTAAQKEFDVRLDAHLNRLGPNAKQTITNIASASTTPDPILSTFLDGVPPPGSKIRRSTFRGLSAWSYDGLLYVRTNVQLAAPNWFASKQSGEIRAYALPDVSTLTISVNGVMTLVNLSD